MVVVAAAALSLSLSLSLALSLSLPVASYHGYMHGLQEMNKKGKETVFVVSHQFELLMTGMHIHI